MKNILLKCSFLLLLITFSLTAASAQEAEPEWIYKHEQNGIKAYYATSACETKDFLALKFENTNTTGSFIHLMMEVTEGKNQMHYPLLDFYLKGGESEIMDCKNLGTTGSFLPFLVRDISATDIVFQDFFVSTN